MNEDELFHLSLEKPDSERAAFLDQACADDAALRRRVEVLLHAHENPGSFLQSPVPAVVATVDEPVSERPGTVIGPYNLLEQIGEGGFGVVFMAEQQRPVRRKVALKVIKPGMDTRQVVARFEAERQALALMDHPNIAHVHDGGETASGRPYFVMELVRGIPIIDFCDQNHLSVRERLDLFINVCQAVQHAHQKGIIHRDLKPSNVMVTMHDSVAVVKVIDFGIAKVTGQQLTEKTLFTNFAQMVGTPMYMSPEQAQMSGLDIDTRTDIYALGVLLYELLTGTTPFDKERLRTAAYDEIRRIIREEEPPKPSTRMSELGSRHTPCAVADGTRSVPATSTISVISANRQSDPGRLRQLFRGDLDWIVMKCLEKDRNRRYETANGLVMDLRRYLHDEPVLACPPSATYRLRKFARRHRVALLTTTLVAGVLVLGTVISTWQAIRATHAERLAAKRLEAETAARQEADGARKQAFSERDQAQRRLYDARLAQARASRWSRQVGQRFASWKALTEAAQFARELELGDEHLLQLRNEAIACLALRDVRLIKEWEGWPPGSSAGLAFDADLKRYARSDLKGNISVRLVADDQEEALLPSDELGEAALGGAAHMLFSPDGKFLAVRYWEHLPGQATNFRLWDWQQGTVVFQLPFPVHGSAMGFSPDGRLLALGQSDGTLTIHDAATGAEEKRMSLGLEPFHLALAPDGSKLAVSSFAGQVQVRDVTTGNLLRPLAIPGRPSQVAWHQAGVLLATACSDSHVYLWDSATGEQRAVLRGHQAPVESVAFTPGSDTLLTTAYDGTSRLWDVWTGRELMRFPGRAYGFSRDGRRLASQAGYNLNLWELAPGREYRTLPGSQASNTEHIRGGGISPNGRWLVVAQGGSYRLWDLHSGTVTNIYSESHAEDAQFHPSGREFFTSGRAGLYRWPVHAEAGVLRIGPARRLPVTGGTGAVALNREGRIVAAAGDRGGWVLDLKKPTGSVAHVEHVNAQSVAISPDGQWVATGTQHGFGVKIWDARIGRLALPEPLIPDERDAAVDFSPDGRWLVIGTGAEFSIWETGSWQLARTFRREQAGGRPGKAAFTPDGKILATEVSTGLVVLLDPASGRRLARLEAPESSPISWLTFTPDGSQLVVCADAGQIAVWNLRRIRQHLTEIGLDWDLQPYSPANEHQRFDPLEVIVDLGNLAQADDSRMHCNRAREHVRAKEWEKAIAEYAEAASLDPDNARAQNNFAWLLVTCPEAEFRDVIRAMKHAEKAVELAPYDDATWNTLGVVRYRAREWAGVIEALKKSEELAPGKYFSFNAFFVALAHWQLGSTGVTDHGSRASDQTLTAEEQAQHKEEARRWYRKAVEWMEKNEPNDEELRRFREEAVELLETKEGKD